MKITKILAVAILLFFTLSSWAQIVIRPGVNSGNTTLPDLLRVGLFNSSQETITGFLDFKIYKNNELKVAGTTNDILITALSNFSITPINASNILLPLKINYTEKVVARSLKNGYVLPDGNYNVCMEFIAAGAIVSEEYCFPKTVGNIIVNPRIQLLYPINDSAPATLNPIFSWTHSGNNFLYEIKITEVLPHQTGIKGSAINNPVFYTENGLSANTFVYPISAPELENCKNYEWQVITYNEALTPLDVGIIKNKQIIGSSQVFRFKTNCPEERVTQSKTAQYFSLTKATSSFVYSLDHSRIAFKYIEKYKAKKVKLAIKDSSGKTIVAVNDFPKKTSLNAGPNYLSINAVTYPDLAGYANTGTGEVFFLELTNKKGEKWKAKFKFK